MGQHRKNRAGCKFSSSLRSISLSRAMRPAMTTSARRWASAAGRTWTITSMRWREDGQIERTPHTPRGLRLAEPQPATFQIPVAGRIAAGVAARAGRPA